MRVGAKLFVSLHSSLKRLQDYFKTFANNFKLNIDTATVNNPF